MKNKILIFFLLILMLIPTYTFAEEKSKYVSLNFKETLEDDGISLKNPNYKETDDQITIYLFRGKTCSFCNSFLHYLNDISIEYGKYFKLVSYEIWGNSNNASLMKETAEFLDQSVGGVPFIIIGDKTFNGYSENLHEEYEKAIMDLYNSKERYDVFEEMENAKTIAKIKEVLKVVVIASICSLFFSAITVTILLIVMKKKNQNLSSKIIELETKLTELKNEKEAKKITKEESKTKKSTKNKQ